MRKSGLLLPITSLPGKYGIGDFGYEALEFIDILDKMGQKIWQILPINSLGYGASPYQPLSSFAGETNLISLDLLVEMKLLTAEDIMFKAEGNDMIDYDMVAALKKPLFKKAYLNFKHECDQKPLDKFIKDNEWLVNYSKFIALKNKNNSKPWNEWNRKDRYSIYSKNYNFDSLIEEIREECFLQYIFHLQWTNIKNYANSKNIEIMGDIPIYVGMDSLDVWENQELFLLKFNKKPKFVAGVPPDYFSVDGQRWGNPIYNWRTLEKTNFDFWKKRIGYNSELFDILRIDHFRAFDTYWQIPASCSTAKKGKWIEAPGYKLFDELYNDNPNLNIVCEDLGDLRPEVGELRDHYNLKGMKIVQFTLDPDEINNNFDDRKNMIIYTGTHDNQTIMGWYLSKELSIRESIDKFLIDNQIFSSDVHKGLIEYTLASIADISIIPVSDVLGLDDSARINIPGTIGFPNWCWKLKDFNNLKNNVEFMKELTTKTNRM